MAKKSVKFSLNVFLLVAATRADSGFNLKSGMSKKKVGQTLMFRGGSKDRVNCLRRTKHTINRPAIAARRAVTKPRMISINADIIDTIVAA